MSFPIIAKDLERVKPSFFGSLCDEISKLGQFDALLSSFILFITDGCIFNEEFGALACDRDCETTTTTTVCLLAETTTTTTTCTPPDAPVITSENEAANNIQIGITGTAQQWRIYRSVDGGAYVFYEFLSGASTTYTDDTCPAGSTYAYKITGYNEGCGESPDSNIITVDLT